MRKDTMEWLSSGLLAGRKVTRCQRRTKVHRLVRRDMEASLPDACRAPALDVYRGTDVSGDVYAVVLSGRSPAHSSGPAMTAALMAAAHYYHLLLFRFDLDSGRWTAVLTREDLAESAKGVE